jgi:nitrogenase molybdenum-iron protein alpha/beta subunit
MSKMENRRGGCAITRENILRRFLQMEDREIRTEEGYDLGTFNFLKAGWWILHIIAIVGVFYLGYLYGGSVF